MKVALVYDRVNKWGGAERVLLSLHELFPEAPLFTSVYDNKKAGWADEFIVKTSFLQKIPFARRHHELFATLMPIAFEAFDFSEYDVVISVTSEFAKGVITKPETTHVSIVLTPTRYLWSGYETYFQNPVLRFVAKPLIHYLRFTDTIMAQRPDVLVAISEEVQNRVQKYYGQESEVIYPPVDVVHTASPKKEGEYFLVVSRLVPYKRIDLAIKAANRLQIPLKIIGQGSEFKKLKKIAGPTIEFLGFVSDEILSEYYKNCKALIFPGVEDFGIVMVEAQSYGKPVIAFKGGAAPEIIQDGVTGILFEKQTIQSLQEALEKFDESRYNSTSCIKNAEKFSQVQFKKKLLDFIFQKHNNIKT